MREFVEMLLFITVFFVSPSVIGLCGAMVPIMVLVLPYTTVSALFAFTFQVLEILAYIFKGHTRAPQHTVLKTVAHHGLSGGEDVFLRDRTLWSIVVPAELPQDTEVLPEMIAAIRNIEFGGVLQLIVVFNTHTPIPLEVEQLVELCQSVASNRFQVLLLEAVGSKSKAENVNVGLSHCEGEFVSLFNADHTPRRDCLQRAAAWFLCDRPGFRVDALQGCVQVRDTNLSLWNKFISIDFDSRLNVSQVASCALWGQGFCFGRNTHWRTDVLRRIQFRSDKMSGGRQAGLEAVALGHRLHFAADVVSTELSPASWRGFYSQRARWAQADYQNLAMLSRLLFSQHTTFWQKLYGTLHMLVPTVGSVLGYFVWSSPFMALTTGLYWRLSPSEQNAMVLIFMANGAAFVLRLSFTVFATALPRKRLLFLPLHILLYDPVYLFFQFVGATREATGYRNWVVTPPRDEDPLRTFDELLRSTTMVPRRVA